MVLDLPDILEISIFLKTIGFYNENGHQRDFENHQKINNVKKTKGFWWFWTFGIRKSPVGAVFFVSWIKDHSSFAILDPNRRILNLARRNARSDWIYVFFSNCPPRSPVSKNATNTRAGTVFDCVFDVVRFSILAGLPGVAAFERLCVG